METALFSFCMELFFSNKLTYLFFIHSNFFCKVVVMLCYLPSLQKMARDKDNFLQYSEKQLRKACISLLESTQPVHTALLRELGVVPTLASQELH